MDASILLDQQPQLIAATGANKKGRRGRETKTTNREFIAVLALTTAMSALAIDTLLPAFPEIRAHYGLPTTSTRVSLLITGFFLGSGLAHIPMGILADRFGRKPTLYASLGIYLIATFATAFAPTLGLMIAARVAWGVGASGPRIITSAMVRDRFEGAAMAQTLSYITTVFTIVPVLAPSLGAVVLHRFGWRAAVLFPGFISVLLAVWLTRIPESLPRERRRSVATRALGSTFREISRVRSSVLLALAVTCLLSVINTYISLAEIITDKVYGRIAQFPLTFGAIAMAMGFAGVINARLVGQLGLRGMLRRTPLLLCGTGVCFALVSVLSNGRPPFYFYAVSLAAVLGFQVLVLPNCNSLALQPLGHVAGLASGMISSVSTIGGAVMGGLVAQQYSGNTNALAIGIAVFTSAALLLIRVATHSVSVNPT